MRSHCLHRIPLFISLRAEGFRWIGLIPAGKPSIHGPWARGRVPECRSTQASPRARSGDVYAARERTRPSARWWPMHVDSVEEGNVGGWSTFRSASQGREDGGECRREARRHRVIADAVPVQCIRRRPGPAVRGAGSCRRSSWAVRCGTRRTWAACSRSGSRAHAPSPVPQ